MKVLVWAACTSQFQTGHSSTDSERKLLNSMTHHSSQWQVISKRGEGPLITRPKTIQKVQSTKLLTGLLKVQERFSQGTESLQHFVVRLPQRNLEAAEYDALKLQWIYRQTGISKSGSTRKCCSHRRWLGLNEWKDNITHTHTQKHLMYYP